jgi:hypothetical protein
VLFGKWKAAHGFDFSMVNSLGSLLLILLALYICGIAVKQNFFDTVSKKKLVKA